jgi:hypothetical protein
LRALRFGKDIGHSWESIVYSCCCHRFGIQIKLGWQAGRGLGGASWRRGIKRWSMDGWDRAINVFRAKICRSKLRGFSRAVTKNNHYAKLESKTFFGPGHFGADQS